MMTFEDTIPIHSDPSRHSNSVVIYVVYLWDNQRFHRVVHLHGGQSVMLLSYEGGTIDDHYPFPKLTVNDNKLIKCIRPYVAFPLCFYAPILYNGRNTLEVHDNAITDKELRTTWSKWHHRHGGD